MGFQIPTRKFTPQSLDNQNLIDHTPDGIRMACPVRLSVKRDGSSWFTFPIEPLVSVKASRTIARRNISKSIVRSGRTTGAGVCGALGASAGLIGSQAVFKPFGTVKELVSQDDYSINIEGILMSGADADSDYAQHCRRWA